MRILNRLGGIELANAYTCIKAISKKKEAIDQRVSTNSSSTGATEQGLEQKEAEDIWDADSQVRRLRIQQEPLDGLRPDRLSDGLSESPLSGRVHGGAAVGRYSRAATSSGKTRSSNIWKTANGWRSTSCRPTSTRRDVDFAVADGKIHFGLSAIKGCGGGAAEAIVAARTAGGPFKRPVRLLRTSRSVRPATARPSKR